MKRKLSAKVPSYFPFTRHVSVEWQLVGMLFYSLLMATLIAGCLFYVGNAFQADPHNGDNLAMFLILFMGLLVVPSSTLLSGAFFGSWRGLLVTLLSIGGGLLITQLLNNQFLSSTTPQSLLFFLPLLLATLLVGGLYDYKQYADWGQSVVIMMLGAIVEVIGLLFVSSGVFSEIMFSPIWFLGCCLFIWLIPLWGFSMAAIQGGLQWFIGCKKAEK